MASRCPKEAVVQRRRKKKRSEGKRDIFRIVFYHVHDGAEIRRLNPASGRIDGKKSLQPFINVSPELALQSTRRKKEGGKGTRRRPAGKKKRRRKENRAAYLYFADEELRGVLGILG